MSDLQELTSRWWDLIPPLALQGTVLLMAIMVVDFLLPRRTWPQLRLFVWWVGLGKLILPPSWASPLQWKSPLENWLPELVGGALLQGAGGSRSVELWASLVMAVWLMGVVASAFITLRGYRAARRSLWELSTSEAPPEVCSVVRRLLERRPVQVRWLPESVDAPEALVLGMLRPTIFLSRDLHGTRLEHVLLHELAHVSRGDLRIAAVEMVIQWLYWFHPLVWWARHRTGVLREHCCDLRVANSLGEHGAQHYRRTLLEIAAAKHGVEMPAGGLGFVRPRNSILLRLAILQSFRGERAWLRRLGTAALVGFLLVVAVPVAGSASRAATQVADFVRRPPGSLQLRYLVFKKIAEEEEARQRTQP